MQQHALAAFLGDAIGDLTAEQIDRLRREANAIHARYPDADHEMERQHALGAAVAYLLGDLDVTLAGNLLRQARTAEREAMARAQQIAAMAVADGMSEVAAAQAAAIDRMTVRKALGKR